MKRIFLAGVALTGLLVFAETPEAQVTPLVPGSYSLGQVRIPMILPSSGSMGNNGALTLNVALDQTYLTAYFYMPANAIVAGSAAGFYYGAMTSTSTATLFNNLYVSGTPATPGTLVPFATTGPGAYAQTTGSAFTAWTVTLPAYALGIFDEVQVHGVITYLSSGTAKTFQVSYGSSFNFIAAAPTATATLAFQGGFANQGVVSKQGSTGNSSGTVATSSTLTFTNGSIDGSLSKSISASLKLAAATDYLILQNIIAQRIIPANN